MVSLILFLALGAFAKFSNLLQYAQKPVELDATYNTLYFTERLDHINRDSGSIQVRVLLKQGASNAPLFVYCGGEAPIEVFYQMNGWLVGTLGPQYNATVAFIEHRYYGDSIPSPFSYKYLNTDQALYDFADIVSQLKPTPTTPVIAFGGGYGGMLSAFFRIKYPHLIDGAISSSAPLLQYLDTDGANYSHWASMDYFNVDRNCEINIYDGFQILDNFVSRPLQYNSLNLIFNPCNPIDTQQDVLTLEDWLSDAFKGIAQFNYPYPANVIASLPSFPVNVTCSLISQYMQTENMWQTLQGFAKVADLFYNSTGNLKCFDTYSNTDSVGDAWHYQQCTELLMPMGQYGLSNDMFPVRD